MYIAFISIPSCIFMTGTDIFLKEFCCHNADEKLVQFRIQPPVKVLTIILWASKISGE